jgi:hypothetical protein
MDIRLDGVEVDGLASAPSGGTTIFACDLLALTREERAHHIRTTTALFGQAVQETHELPDGYALRFAAEQYPQVAAFVQYERLCCPFLSFEVEVHAERGPVELRLTGPEGVKGFLVDELQLEMSPRDASNE